MADLLPVAVDLANVRAALGSKDQALVTALTKKFRKQLKDVDRLAHELEAEDADDDAEGPSPGASCADVLRHLVTGEQPDRPVHFNFMYGYALEYMCVHLGQQLPRDNWFELAGSRWVPAIDEALRSAGVAADVLSVRQQLTGRGSPVPIPEYDDWPEIGYLTKVEIERALVAFADARVREDMDDYVDDIHGWLQKCAELHSDLICFCSDHGLEPPPEAKPPRAAAATAKGPDKPLLARLPKRTRDRIARIMNEHDGRLSLEEFLAREWDSNMSEILNPPVEFAKLFADHHSQVADVHPDWSPEQIQTALCLDRSAYNVKEMGIARRVSLEDPAELGRALGVLNGLRYGKLGHRWRELLQVCAVGDIAIAQDLVAGRRGGQLVPDEEDLADIGLVAVLQNDWETLEFLLPDMAKRRGTGPWLKGLYECLTGLAERRPNQTSAGLETLFTAKGQRDELEYAIDLWTHGLYRLCEWISPDLVAGFDVGRPIPWDAEFHAWCESHPNPVVGLDLTRISPVLHEIVALRKIPSWLKAPPVLYEVVLLSADPNRKDLVALVEQRGGRRRTVRETKELMQRCPLVLCWNLPKKYAEQDQKFLQEAGATVEIRVMPPTPFRFC